MPKRKTEKKEEKQLKKILGILALIIIGVVIGIFLFKGNTKFKYAGLDFDLQYHGEIPIYHTTIPILDQNGNLYKYFNLFFRNDPRDLRKIEVPRFMRIQNNVILAADSDIGACDDGSLAGVLIGQFITIGRSVQVASTNQTYAEETGYDFANCNNVTADTTVIITRKGEENKIIDQNGCYIIQFKECDILKSTERFIVGVLASYNNIIL